MKFEDIKVNTIWKSSWDSFIVIIDIFQFNSSTIVKYRQLSIQDPSILFQERYASEFLNYFTPLTLEDLNEI